MTDFVKNESYMHKCAKDVFKQWCESKEWDTDTEDYKGVSTDYNTCISWRSNRDKESFLEYPIVVNDRKNINSIENNWDEIWEDDDKLWSCFVPTYKQCIDKKLIPIAIVDVVLSHKGIPLYFIEICHKNPVSNAKIQKLKENGVENLIEIDASWILKQTHIPSKLKIKRWLL